MIETQTKWKITHGINMKLNPMKFDQLIHEKKQDASSYIHIESKLMLKTRKEWNLSEQHRIK